LKSIIVSELLEPTLDERGRVHRGANLIDPRQPGPEMLSIALGQSEQRFRVPAV
jgi:hypothetical protein